MTSVLRFWFVIIILLVSASGLSAQLTSDVVPRERLIPRAEQVRRELETSSRRLGPFRILPEFQIRNLGYSDNVFGAREDEEQVEDFSGSVAVGTRWILPFGPKGYLRGGLLPEYTWSKELPERRFLGGSYDISAIALFNRLSLEATAAQSKSLAQVTTETQAEAIGDLTTFGVDGEIDLTGKISLFGSARGQQVEYELESAGAAPIATVSELNREDTAVRGGIRYKVRTFLDLSVAAEETRSSFDARELERDNGSQAVLVGVHYELPRAYLNATVGRREGEPEGGSSFPPYETTVGSYFGALAPGGRLELQTFGHRTVRYSLSVEEPYYFETSNGLGTVARIGNRLRLRASGEFGRHEYLVRRDMGGVAAPREDDVITYGAGFDVRIYRNVALTVFVSESQFDSNVESFDRSIARIQTGITLTGDFSR